MREGHGRVAKQEQPPREKENVESLETLSDNQLETIIGEAAYVNSGNNGVILRVDLDNFPELKKRIPDDSKAKAIKLLKVHRPGEGVKEFEVQNRAYESVHNAPNKDELAIIPRPLLFRDIPVSEKTNDFLRRQGVQVGTHAEVLLMDYVEGQDLATIFDEWIIENANPNELMPRSHSFEHVHAAVAQILDFKVPGGKAIREGEQIYEEKKVHMGNADKLYRTLKKTGFKLPEGFRARLQKTITLLHENGIYHNDPHERNFMIDSDNNPYIVDFGSADTQRREDRVSDEYILNRLKELEGVEEDYAGEFDKILNRFANDPQWNKNYESFVTQLPLSLDNLPLQLVTASANELKFEKTMTILVKALKDKNITQKDLTKKLTEAIETKKLPPWAFTKVNKVLAMIGH